MRTATVKRQRKWSRFGPLIWLEVTLDGQLLGRVRNVIVHGVHGVETYDTDYPQQWMCDGQAAVMRLCRDCGVKPPMSKERLDGMATVVRSVLVDGGLPAPPGAAWLKTADRWAA